MRNEESYLDLNNLPDEFSRDGNKQALEEGSSSGQRKKKGSKEVEKDETGKVYECRFCSLKFCKSQALGGHMNRHRQERESETLNQARQLVYRNDTLTPPGISPFSYHSTDPTMYRSVYSSPMIFHGGSQTNMIPQQPLPLPLPAMQLHPTQSYSPHHMNDYYLGHSLRGNRSISPNPNLPIESSYACIGAPVSRGSGLRETTEPNLPQGRERDGSRQHLDHSLRLPITRFQDHH